MESKVEYIIASDYLSDLRTRHRFLSAKAESLKAMLNSAKSEMIVLEQRIREIEEGQQLPLPL